MLFGVDTILGLCGEFSFLPTVMFSFGAAVEFYLGYFAPLIIVVVSHIKVTHKRVCLFVCKRFVPPTILRSVGILFMYFFVCLVAPNLPVWWLGKGNAWQTPGGGGGGGHINATGLFVRFFESDPKKVPRSCLVFLVPS